MKHWEHYLDDNDLVVQKSGDGGDSLNRTCACYVLGHLALPEEEQDIRWHVVHQLAEFGDDGFEFTGKFRRSNHLNKWYSNFDRTSRDQLIPLVILCGLRWPKTLKLIFKDHLKRALLFAYNTRHNFQYPTLVKHLELSTPDVKWNYKWKLPDFTGPEFWALYIRGLKLWYLYPLLYLFDLETLFGSIHIEARKDKDDVINHTLVLEFAKVRMDTWVMKLARWVTPRPLLQERLDVFFGKEEEPPINEIFRLLNK